MDTVPMTVAGHAALKEELRRLKTEERPAIVRAIEEARAHGDLSENAEYAAAKERQGFIEGRISEVEAKLGNAQIIDPTTIVVASSSVRPRMSFLLSLVFASDMEIRRFLVQFRGQDTIPRITRSITERD